MEGTELFQQGLCVHLGADSRSGCENCTLPGTGEGDIFTRDIDNLCLGRKE